MKTKKNKLLLAAIIITYISIGLSAISILGIAFNIMGIKDIVSEYLISFGGEQDIDATFTMFYIETTVALLVNFYAVSNYTKVYSYRLNNKDAGRFLTNVAFWQILFCSLLPGLLAIIAGVKMSRRKVEVQTTNANPYISDYKLTAMADAVNRLKELRDKGAISEEEYYASLNKVLEG